MYYLDKLVNDEILKIIFVCISQSDVLKEISTTKIFSFFLQTDLQRQTFEGFFCVDFFSFHKQGASWQPK